MNEDVVLDPLLPNSRDGRVTRHDFIEEKPVCAASGRRIGFEHLYRCRETGATRRWGLTRTQMGYKPRRNVLPSNIN